MSVVTVELSEVPAQRRPLLDNLLQLYLHDFSEFAAVGEPYGEVGTDGRFPCVHLDDYWRDGDRLPLAIGADGHIAGFALVNRWSALGRPLDRAVAEFFIVRKYRRHRVGLRAVSLLLGRFPGRWEVPVAGYNAPALAFWRKTIEIASGSPADEVAGDGERWAGTVLCFEAKR